MSNFCPSSTSYLTYCITTNFRIGNAICQDFSQAFQILLPPGQFKKNYEKNLFLKKMNYFLPKF